MRQLLTYLLCTLVMISGYCDENNEELILSTPDQIAAISAHSDHLIGGVVSPLSGNPILRKTDFVIKGAQNISLTRIYNPPYIPLMFSQHMKHQEKYDKQALAKHLRKTYKGWEIFPHTELIFYPNDAKVRLTDRNGSTVDYAVVSGETKLWFKPHGISNASGDEVGGKFDLRNVKILIEDKLQTLKVHTPDGTIKVYTFYGDSGLPGIAMSYLLKKEILPNGKILKFTYNRKQLTRVESLDPLEQHVYASLELSGNRTDGKCHFNSSTGLSGDYGFHIIQVHEKFQDKVEGVKRQIEFKTNFPPLLASISSPAYRNEFINYTNRCLLESYFGNNQIFALQYQATGAFNNMKVHQLLFPVGADESFQVVHDIKYSTSPQAGKRAGVTEVKNNDGSSILYHFSSQLLMTKIQYFETEGKLSKEKIFTWSKNNWLQSIEIQDGNGNLFYKKNHEFDNFGNPILEICEGDLTGTGTQENYRIRKEYSQDGFNLLLKEEHDNGKIILYTYLPKTNLITSKLIKDHEKVLQREFSKYDECNNLIQFISDNGIEEDTQRTIKNYILRQQAPFLHMPEWIEEKYSEGETEKLLTRRHFSYDSYGNIAEEEIYDADEKYAYTIYKEYNERGDILSETNVLGQKATYGYDDWGYCISETNFSGRLQTLTHYDMNGRALEKKELGDDGIEHVTQYKYDFHNRLIQHIDHYQNETHYRYDPIAHKVNHTHFPSVENEFGQSTTVQTETIYDVMGRKTVAIDANGNPTKYSYNAYGSKTKVIHPNGGIETYHYAKDGTLASYQDQTGLIILYAQDVLGRTISKSYISSQGEQITKEEYSYDGLKLLSETDKEGNLTLYSYDGAGRKIQENFAGQITQFTYDSLGRISVVCKLNDPSPLFIHYVKDLSGQVLDESKTDSSGQILYKIAYSYDGDGNRTSVTRFINGNESIEVLEYDSFGRIVQNIDPYQNITKRVYNENYPNNLGQKVLQTSITDPLGIVTQLTYDTYDRISKKEVLNSLGMKLSYNEKIYDPAGNLLQQKDHLYEKDIHNSTQLIKYTYTPLHKIESLRKACGTINERLTTYTYELSGRMSTKTLPSGLTLSYQYNPLGFLQKITSTDDAIVHSFTYDNLGRLTSAVDEKLNIEISRHVDPFGNVTKETFSNGLEIGKDYDKFNRITSLKISGMGSIDYFYDPLYLRQVTRKSNAGEELYSHQYENYDQNGSLLSEQMIRSSGQIQHKIDLKGQKEAINNPYFTQNCKYDAVGNLTQNITDNEEHLYSYDELSQLSTEKSPSLSSEYVHDSLYNRTQKDSQKLELNSLNQLVNYQYDLNGNQTTLVNGFELNYDPLNRLIEANSSDKKIAFSYDPLGRCLKKTTFEKGSTTWIEKDNEHYLYDGENEIGALSSNLEAKNLRILGLNQRKSPLTVAIELNGKPFAPILDVQGNIRQLIDLHSRTPEVQYEYTAFGESLINANQPDLNPWRYASKRFDPELGILYFGNRFYDPSTARWLSEDPAGYVDSSNLYQYVFNNPFRYKDPDGKFIIAITLFYWGSVISLPTITSIITPILYCAATAAVSYAGYQFGEYINKTSEDVYAPERELLRDEDGNPIPDEDAKGTKHTQLGTRESKKGRGKYAQSREFEENNSHIGDNDFTDHGHPDKHPNPHRHNYEENETGGTRTRGKKSEPLPHWDYNAS